MYIKQHNKTQHITKTQHENQNCFIKTHTNPVSGAHDKKKQNRSPKLGKARTVRGGEQNPISLTICTNPYRQSLIRE